MHLNECIQIQRPAASVLALAMSEETESDEQSNRHVRMSIVEIESRKAISRRVHARARWPAFQHRLALSSERTHKIRCKAEPSRAEPIQSKYLSGTIPLGAESVYSRILVSKRRRDTCTWPATGNREREKKNPKNRKATTVGGRS